MFNYITGIIRLLQEIRDELRDLNMRLSKDNRVIRPVVNSPRIPGRVRR